MYQPANKTMVIGVIEVLVFLGLNVEVTLATTKDVLNKSSEEYDVEQSLIHFQDKFLGYAHDYTEIINYPNMFDNDLSFVPLTIRVGQQVTCIIIFECSKPIVKIIDQSKNIVSNNSDSIIPSVTAEIDKSIMDRTDSILSEQSEISRLRSKVVPEAASILSKISLIPGKQRQKEYRKTLSVMLQRVTEITIYRQMLWETYDKDIGISLDKLLTEVIAHDKYDPNEALIKKVNGYIAGRITKDDAKSYLCDEIAKRIHSNSKLRIWGIVKKIKYELKNIHERRNELNKYDWSRDSQIEKKITYSQLVKDVASSPDWDSMAIQY